ncbi:unnamed protein product [Lampetra planeri]
MAQWMGHAAGSQAKAGEEITHRDSPGSAAHHGFAPCAASQLHGAPGGGSCLAAWHGRRLPPPRRSQLQWARDARDGSRGFQQWTPVAVETDGSGISRGSASPRCRCQASPVVVVAAAGDCEEEEDDAPGIPTRRASPSPRGARSRHVTAISLDP